MPRDFYKYGPLMIRIQNTNQYGMYSVEVFAEGKSLDLIIPWTGEDPRELAEEVLSDLHEASTNPSLFLSRRRMAAEQAEKSMFVKEKMIGLAEKAVAYAKSMKRLLDQAMRYRTLL